MWKNFTDWLVFKLLKMSPLSFWGEFVNFVIYDFFKIISMVFTIMLIVSFLRSFLSEENLNKTLSKNMFGLNYLAASIFGAITPFCSCSGIPIFIGMVEAGVPLGVAISFLVTSPIVNEVVVILMGNYYGWGLATIYALSGILLGVTSGLIISHLNLDKELTLKAKQTCCSIGKNNNCCGGKELPITIMKTRLNFAWNETTRLMKDIWKFILLGVTLGGLIHNLIPQSIIHKYTGAKNWWTVPLAVLFGIPMYAGCSTVAPAIFSITSQGVELGTSLALLMSIAGLSLPEAMILKSSISIKLLLIFFSIVGAGIISIGYLFNFLL